MYFVFLTYKNRLLILSQFEIFSISWSTTFNNSLRLKCIKMFVSKTKLDKLVYIESEEQHGETKWSHLPSLILRNNYYKKWRCNVLACHFIQFVYISVRSMRVSFMRLCPVVVEQLQIQRNLECLIWNSGGSRTLTIGLEIGRSQHLFSVEFLHLIAELSKHS